MHTLMSTSLINHYQANLQGYRTCTGVAKVELSASPSKNTLAIYIFTNIYTHHMTQVRFFIHLPTYPSYTHTPPHTRHTSPPTYLHTHMLPPTHTHTHITTCLPTHTHAFHPHTPTHTHTHQFLEEMVSVLAVFQWTHFPTVIHHIRTQPYLVIV